MPMYSYKCPDCGRVADEFRSVDDRNDGPTCAEGHEPAPMRRLFQTPGYTIEGKAYIEYGPSWIDKGDI